MEIVLVIHLKRQAIRSVFRARPFLEYDRLRKGSRCHAADRLSECLECLDTLDIQIRLVGSLF